MKPDENLMKIPSNRLYKELHDTTQPDWKQEYRALVGCGFK